MKKNIFFLCLGLLLGIILSLAISAISFYDNYKKNKDFKVYKGYSDEIGEIITIIDKNFIGDKKINKENIFSFAIQGIFNGLNDKYSEFLSSEELGNEVKDLKGIYAGLGFEALKEKNRYLEILTIYPDSPAFKAGLMLKDKILEIDGNKTKNMSSIKTLKLIRGKIGSVVNLKIKRENLVFNIKILREEIKSQVIDFKMINNKIGYIYLSQFPMEISKKFNYAIKELKKRGMSKLILDLRGNRGGEITELVDIASVLLSEDKIFLFSINYKNCKSVDYNRSLKQIFDGDIVVLTNSSTASASEILIAILRDYKRAVIIGEKTFGKGRIQKFYYLKSGNILKLTVGEYITPNKNKIEGVGILPDIKIFQKSFINKDIKLEKAIYYLNNI